MTKIDVLVVMDSMASRAFDHDKDLVIAGLMKNEKAGELSQQRREARAAVAELIEAAKDAREMLSLVHDITGKVGTRLTAALARIGGSA